MLVLDGKELKMKVKHTLMASNGKALWRVNLLSLNLQYWFTTADEKRAYCMLHTIFPPGLFAKNYNIGPGY